MQQLGRYDISEFFAIKINEFLNSVFVHLLVTIRDNEIKFFSDKFIPANLNHAAEPTADWVYYQFIVILYIIAWLITNFCVSKVFLSILKVTFFVILNPNAHSESFRYIVFKNIDLF